MHSSATLIGGSLGLWPWMTLLAPFDWQSAAQQTISSTHAHSPEISPYLFKDTLVFPKHGLNRNQNVTAGIKHSLKKSMIFNLQTSDPTVIDTSSDAVGQTSAASTTRWNIKIRWEKFRQSHRYAIYRAPHIQILRHLRMVPDMQTKHLSDWWKVSFLSGCLGIYQREVSVSAVSCCLCLGETEADDALATILVNEHMLILTQFTTWDPNFSLNK